MRKVNQEDVPEERRLSPKEMYEVYRKHLSLKIGGKKDVGVWGGGHPFDIERARIPPGKINYPLHAHAAQYEHYIILSGRGTVRSDSNEEVEIKPGDHFILYPGEAHQIINTGNEDLVYYVVSDHPPADVTTYPHSGKRQIKPEYRSFRMVEVDYYEGEE